MNVPTATALCQQLMNISSANHGIVERFGLEETLKNSLFQPSVLDRDTLH